MKKEKEEEENVIHLKINQKNFFLLLVSCGIIDVNLLINNSKNSIKYRSNSSPIFIHAISVKHFVAGFLKVGSGINYLKIY